MTLAADIRSGLRSGIRSGINPTDDAPFWSVDSTSSKATPADADEWADLLASVGIASGGPSHVWNCQEASGDLVDAIGSLTLSAGGSPGYQQTVSGWARKAVTIADGSTTDKFAAAGGSGPNVATESALWLFYVSLPTTPAALSFAGQSAAYPTGRSFAMSTGNKIISYLRNANVNGTQNHNALGPFPLVLQYDRTNSTAVTFTHLEKIAHSYVSTAADGAKGFGAITGSASPAQAVVYAAAFEGAAAEMSQASIKALLQAAGWAVAWSP